MLELPLNERPREKFIELGRENLTLSELFAIIIRTGTNKKSVLEIARELTTFIANENNFYDLTIDELANFIGIGKIKATEILAIFEISKRLEKIEQNKIVFNKSFSVFEFMKADFIGLEQEVFYALYLDAKCRLKLKKKLFIGTLNKSIVHLREIFKWAVKVSAGSIIVVHNHPSGNTKPSGEDKELTRRIKETSELIGIQFLDHLIMSSDNYFSFCDSEEL